MHAILFVTMLIVCSTTSKIVRLPLTIIDCSENGQTCLNAARSVGIAHARLTYGHSQSLIDIDLFNDDKEMYMMTSIHFGNDKKSIDLIVDSGSSNLWINRDDCGNDDTGLKGDCDAATTPKSLYYLDGEIHGKMAKTSVWLNNGQIESRDHHVTIITKKSELMNYGILGMARGYDAEPTFLMTLKDNGVIEKQAFAIYTDNEKSTLVLGGVDQSLVQAGAAEVTVPLINKDSFYFKIEGARFGDEIISMEFTNALADSGNTLISFPAYLSNTVVNTLSKLGLECFLLKESNPLFHELVCKMTDEQLFPDLHFVIKDTLFTVTGDHLKSTCYQTNGGFFYDDYVSEIKECLIKIEFFGNGNYFTLGKAFLQKVYTTFNLDDQTITFAQNK